MNYPQPVISPMGQVTNFKVTKFLLVETGTYNKQYNRPFEVDVRADTVDQIRTVVNNDPHISAANLAGISNSFFHPSANPESEVGILHGWEQRRYRYMLEIQYERGGLSHAEVILGYTEYDGITSTNAVDDQMRFFVNSVITTRMIATPTANGMVNLRQISDNSQVLIDPVWKTGTSTIMNHNNVYNLRPEDVYGVMGSAHDLHLLQQYNVMDSRNLSRNDPRMSSRRYNIASQYTAGMLNAYNTAALSTQGTEEEIYADAKGLVRSMPSDHSNFLKKLRQLSGAPTAAFTMRDLRNMEPNIDFIKDVTHLSDVQRVQEVHTVGSTAHWHSSDSETLYASILAQSMPAMMMEYGLVQLNVMSTNNHATALPYTRILHATPFASLDVTRACAAFQNRFEIEVIRDFTFNNAISYQIQCSFDLLGESRIRISLNNQESVDYVVPSFADSIFSPMMTHNPQRCAVIATNFQQLFTGLESPSPQPYVDSYQNPDLSTYISTPGSMLTSSEMQASATPVVANPYQPSQPQPGVNPMDLGNYTV